MEKCISTVTIPLSEYNELQSELDSLNSQFKAINDNTVYITLDTYDYGKYPFLKSGIKASILTVDDMVKDLSKSLQDANDRVKELREEAEYKDSKIASLEEKCNRKSWVKQLFGIK